MKQDTVVIDVSKVAVAVGDTADAVGETANIVVGTGVGVVIEIFGGEQNGRTCPPANLSTNEKWIENLDSNLKLNNLVLPGIHHHGLVEGQSRYDGPVPGGKVMDWAVTQSLSVIDQLRTGARFLDIRLTKAKGKIYTAHGREQKIVTLGLVFDDILIDHIRFLKDNSKEFLVWTFMWEYGESHWSEVEEKLSKFKDEFFYIGESPFDQPLSAMAGKIIICKEGQQNLLEYRTLDYTGSWPVTKDKDPTRLVENINEYVKHQREGFNYIEAVATIDADGIIESLNTFSASPDNLKDLACQVNELLKEGFLIQENQNFTKNFQAVMVDYSVYYQVINGILDFNHRSVNYL